MKTFKMTVCLNVEDGTSHEDTRAWLQEHLVLLGLENPEVWLGKSTEHADVREFHHKFQVPQAFKPSFLGPKALEFRKKFLVEELNEFITAHAEGDMAGVADALVDLVYVAHGTAAMMGIPWFPVWSEVQRANMSKIRAQDASESKRGSALDVIKPFGWVAPDHSSAVGEGPWDTLEEV